MSLARSGEIQVCDKELLKVYETRLQSVGSVGWTQANKVAGALTKGVGRMGQLE